MVHQGCFADKHRVVGSGFFPFAVGWGCGGRLPLELLAEGVGLGCCQLASVVRRRFFIPTTGWRALAAGSFYMYICTWKAALSSASLRRHKLESPTSGPATKPQSSMPNWNGLAQITHRFHSCTWLRQRFRAGKVSASVVGRLSESARHRRIARHLPRQLANPDGHLPFLLAYFNVPLSGTCPNRNCGWSLRRTRREAWPIGQ